MYYIKAASIVVGLFFWTVSVGNCQALNLFEELQSADSRGQESSSRPVRRDSDGNILSEVYFRLVGTSKIGSNFMVTVRDSGSEIISFKKSFESATSIPGHPEYFLVDAGPRDVSIQYPEGVPCVEHLNEGVMCPEVNVAKVALTNGSPLKIVTSQDVGSVATNASNDDETDLNPFAAILERQSNLDSEPSDSSFTPRRISPEDVPPGMRVVSTPFGDRLVEDE